MTRAQQLNDKATSPQPTPAIPPARWARLWGLLLLEFRQVLSRELATRSDLPLNLDRLLFGLLAEV